LKKSPKKLLLHWLARPIRPARREENKSFLVLFFKKELLPSHLGCFGGESLSMRLVLYQPAKQYVVARSA
jgi:hypothetical protein